jgi:hypothetical protein
MMEILATGAQIHKAMELRWPESMFGVCRTMDCISVPVRKIFSVKTRFSQRRHCDYPLSSDN